MLNHSHTIPVLSVSPAGLTLARPDGWCALAPQATWLEVAMPYGVESPTFHAADEALHAQVGPLHIKVTFEEDAGLHAPLPCITCSVTHTGADPVAVNLKWTLPLAEQDTAPRWLIPALLYKDNAQQYTGLPSLAGEANLAESRWPVWTFRADLTAVPMVMAWTAGGSVALVMEEQLHGQMVGIGLDNRPGCRAIVGTWPYREEPRRRDIAPLDADPLQPVITFATLQPGETATIVFHLHAGDTDPYAFAPLLRETFRRWDAQHPGNPWFSTRAGIDHAAYGLYHWHYDPEHAVLWETCAYDRYYAKNDRHVDRFDMHTGFVSGIPYAHPLRQYGLKYDRPEMADAGKHVIDFCCSNLTPWGTFWSKYSLESGWTTGWPAAHRTQGKAVMDDSVREIQSRTIAEATIFAARAAQVEHDAASRTLWTRAVCSNLDFVLRTQRADGNPGQIYSATDGAVLDWDGDEGLHWITALVEGYRLTGQEAYLEAARLAGTYYRPGVENAYLTGAPEGTHLLPTSEDPQNAVMAYVNLWEASGDAQWLALARQAADYLMTFRWQYNTVFSPMTLLGRYDYRTKGMDISSPNNVHLHPFGLIVTPELVRLWEATGDNYLLKQTRNHLLACHQMLATEHGVFDARRGMMTERWYQTPGGIPKGGTLQVSHAWAIGLVLYADLFAQEYGQLLLDGETGELTALEAVIVSGEAAAYQVYNPWETALDLVLVARHATGTITIDAQPYHVDGSNCRIPLHIAAGTSIRIATG